MGEKRRFPYIMGFLWAFVIACIGMGAYWVYSTDLLVPLSERDGSVPNPVKRLPTEDFNPNEQSSNLRWLNIFEPGDARGLVSNDGSDVELLEEGDRKFARLITRNGSRIGIEIPPGQLKEVRGRKVVFELSVRSADGAVNEFSITCDFNVFGECGRKRFSAVEQAEPYLFEVDFARPDYENQPGFIYVDASIDGSGRPIDLYSVRMQIQKET